MPVAVVTDTTGYLPRELLDRYSITAVPLYVVFPDRTVRETEITDYPAEMEAVDAEADVDSELLAMPLNDEDPDAARDGDARA